VKELFQGRRFGFSPRVAIAFVAVGLGIALTLSDFMAWFAWGAKDTSGFVVVSYWLASAVTVVLALALLTALAELLDAPPEDRGLARLDLLAGIVAFILYGASAFLRGGDVSAAAAAPAPFLLAIAALLVTSVDAAVAANLYSAREWEELEEEPAREHRQRRRAASR
jgi:uncharacterized membrane protein